MKFKGQPNLVVRVLPKHWRRGMPKKIVFDADGYCESDNERMCKLLSARFEKAKLYECKQCDFATESRGDLMTHYRLEHPKEKDGGK